MTTDTDYYFATKMRSYNNRSGKADNDFRKSGENLTRTPQMEKYESRLRKSGMYLTRYSVRFRIKIPLSKIRYFELDHVLEISPIGDK